MPKVMRLIIYEGSERALAQQLGRSMSEGIRLGQAKDTCTITITRVPETIQLLLEEAAVGLAEALARAQAHEIAAADFFQRTIDSDDPHGGIA